MTTAIDERRAELTRMIEAAEEEERDLRNRAAERLMDATIWRAELAGIEWAIETQLPRIVLHWGLGADGYCQNETANQETRA